MTKIKELFTLLAHCSLHNLSQIHVITNVNTQILSCKNQDVTFDGTSYEKMKEANFSIWLAMV